MHPAYLRGLSHLGSLAISDSDLKRIEKIAATLKDNAWALKSAAAADAAKLLQQADRTAGKVQGAVIAGAVVTAISTAVLVHQAVKARMGGFA